MHRLTQAFSTGLCWIDDMTYHNPIRYKDIKGKNVQGECVFPRQRAFGTMGFYFQDNEELEKWASGIMIHQRNVQSPIILNV